MFALERPFTALVDGVSVEAAGIAIGSDDPERGPDSGGVHRRADTYEPLFRWSIQHSSYVYGTSDVYEYLQKAWAFTIEPVVERITRDVLLLSAREDLLVDFSLYKQEIDLLKKHPLSGVRGARPNTERPSQLQHGQYQVYAGPDPELERPDAGTITGQVPIKSKPTCKGNGHGSIESCPSPVFQRRAAELPGKDRRKFALIFVAHLCRDLGYPQFGVPQQLRSPAHPCLPEPRRRGFLQTPRGNSFLKLVSPIWNRSASSRAVWFWLRSDRRME